MYLLRGAVVSLGVFFLVYVALSVIVACVWAFVGRKLPPRSDAALYGIRVAPLFGACALVAFFTVPSFLYLEPRSTGETIGVSAFALAAGGAAVLVAGCINAVKAWLKTARFVTACLEQARRLEMPAGIPAYEVLGGAPTLCVSGVWRPKLLVSSAVVALLDPVEIEAAIRHEVAHVHHQDNLKKLVLRFCPFPALASLEREWSRAAEIAADDDAVCHERTALDLASALLKMARASAQARTPELGMTLVPERGAAVSTRVERLLAWKPSPRRRLRHFQWALLVGALVSVGLNYAWVLGLMHELTELLIR
jgi:Zn-dependent protease with chaperone function